MSTSTNILPGSPTYILNTVPPRPASPTRINTSRPTPPPRMPSPRSSPALRPTSPLSPGRFDTLQPPSPRNTMHRPASNTTRRANTKTNNLKLPSLPRFHPANFPSAHSSTQTTPDSTGLNSPPPPVSPRAHQRVISDAQKHLLMYQREMVSAARASSPSAQIDDPLSPRLAPLGSPGPVTPLELEETEEGYLVAGAGGRAVGNEELVERLIREETGRMLQQQQQQQQRRGVGGGSPVRTGSR